MARKYYAVRSGRMTGIFDTWEECSRQVTGVSGAEFKSFASLDDARAYMQGDAPQQPRDDAAAYVDGSYDAATGRYSYGMVILYNGEEIKRSDSFSDAELSAMHNVAGEIRGATEAMLYCIENGIPALTIYYDYSGIEKWCTGEWKTNKPGTIAYKAYYDLAKTKIAIRFVKVKGHSGDKYNDAADKLAKQALGLQ